MNPLSLPPGENFLEGRWDDVVASADDLFVQLRGSIEHLGLGPINRIPIVCEL